MKLSPVLNMLFWAACLIGFLLPLLKSNIKAQFSFRMGEAQRSSLALGLPPILLAGVGALFLKLEPSNTLLFALGGFLGAWLLSCLNLSTGLAGVPLLVAAYFIAGMSPDPTLVQMPLLAYVAGLTVAQIAIRPLRLEALLLPGIFCGGSYWITVSSPENWVTSYQTLLILALSIALILRGLQTLPLLPENTFIRGAFVTVMSGLAAWLGIQNLLLQPGLLNWAWLFAGGSLLGFLLSQPEETQGTSRLQGVIQLLLTGIAMLVASRLFGTVGWLVLAAMLLTNARASKTVALISLFFVGRVLLQGFIYQFNPNITGINITHPYASAALYVGLAVMLILPGYLNSLFTDADADDFQPSQAYMVPATLGFLSARLANYFLHAEATGSLLTALIIGALGISLLGQFNRTVNRAYPLLLALLMTLGALLGNALIEAGNSAEKPEKLWTLGGAVVVFAIGWAIAQKGASGHKPVQVS